MKFKQIMPAPEGLMIGSMAIPKGHVTASSEYLDEIKYISRGVSVVAYGLSEDGWRIQPLIEAPNGNLCAISPEIIVHTYYKDEK